MKLLITGIGQSCRGDDRVGLEAVQYWLKKHPEHINDSRIRVELLDTPVVNLLDVLHGVKNVIIVDAIKGYGPPGKVYVINDVTKLRFLESNSSHGIGVIETLTLGRTLEPDSFPADIIFIGIEIEKVDFGEALSPMVKRALPKVAKLIEKYTQKYLA